MRILIINGPNLNLLGTREPDVYGSTSLAQVEESLRSTFDDVDLEFFQSNHEGAIIDRLHDAAVRDFHGIVLNPAGYSHTSIALRDAVAAITIPVVEVHVSNIHARDAFRDRSVVAGACVGVITGLGPAGYALAVRYLMDAHRA